MKTFNYTENVNYNEDRYAPGLYRIHNTEGSPFYIDMGEYVSPIQMERYIENHFEFSQDGDSVTGIDYLGSKADIKDFDKVAEKLIALPFNRKLFNGPVSIEDWGKFHKARLFNKVANYIQRDDSSNAWSIGDSTLFYVRNNEYQHSNFESGSCHKMLQHCSPQEIYEFYLDNVCIES